MSGNSVMVGEGAVLTCSFGTATSKLKVMDHGVRTVNKNQALITDRVPLVNIMPFCSCKRPDAATPIPCTPAIVMNWLKSDSNLNIAGVPVLQQNCIVPCTFGGMIEIIKE